MNKPITVEERFKNWWLERFGTEYSNTFPEGDFYDFLKSELALSRNSWEAELREKIEELKQTMYRHFEYRGALNGMDFYGKIEMDNKIDDILSLLTNPNKEEKK